MPDVDPSWTLVVPTKHSANAKSRLEPALGRWRVRLARAFARDTILSARSCSLVGRVFVVGDGHGLEDDAAPDDIEVIEDPTRGGDMNLAVVAGLEAARATGCGVLAVLTADLPALLPEELDAALRAALQPPVSAVSDTEGRGTTFLATTLAGPLRPRFGYDSFARHVEAGAQPLTAGPGLTRDIDLPEHLTQASALGVGPSTTAVLEAMGLT